MKPALAQAVALVVLCVSPAALAADAPPPLPSPVTAPEGKVADPQPVLANQGNVSPASVTPSGDAASAADLQRTRAMLQTLASGESGYRLTSGIVGLGLGAVTIPIGISMLTRTTTSPNDKYVYVGGGAILGAGLGAVIGGALNLALSIDPSVRIYEGFERRAALGVPIEQNISETEADWRTRAQGAQSARKFVGGLSMAVGVVGMGVGTYYSLSPRMSSYVRSEQDAIGALFVVSGMISVLAGLQSFFWKSSVESSWEGYRGAKGIAKAPAFRPQLGAAPLPGGGLLSLQSLF